MNASTAKTKTSSLIKKDDYIQKFRGYFGHEVKIQLVRESKPVKECVITTPDDVFNLVKDELRDSDREIFLSVQLNTRNKVLGINVVSVGTLNASLIHPREVFKPAILQNAGAIILVHNHPSGTEDPSTEDIAMTNRLSEAGKLLDIEVLDHVIVGNTFYSFLHKGLIEKKYKGGLTC